MNMLAINYLMTAAQAKGVSTEGLKAALSLEPVTKALTVSTRAAAAEGGINLSNIASALAVASFAGIGVIMAGYFFFPEQAQRYKREIPTIIVGLILVAITGVLMNNLGGDDTGMSGTLGIDAPK